MSLHIRSSLNIMSHNVELKNLYLLWNMVTMKVWRTNLYIANWNPALWWAKLSIWNMCFIIPNKHGRSLNLSTPHFGLARETVSWNKQRAAINQNPQLTPSGWPCPRAPPLLRGPSWHPWNRLLHLWRRHRCNHLFQLTLTLAAAAHPWEILAF